MFYCFSKRPLAEGESIIYANKTSTTSDCTSFKSMPSFVTSIDSADVIDDLASSLHSSPPPTSVQPGTEEITGIFVV
jgi:hypothetical protein